MVRLQSRVVYLNCMRERQAFKPQSEAEWFKVRLQRTIQINHDKTIDSSLNGLYYDIKQLVSMDTTVPVV